MRGFRTLVQVLILLGLLWPVLGFSAAESGPKLPLIRLNSGPFVNGCEEARKERSDFAASNRISCVQTWLELRDLSGVHGLQFLYYDPSGNLYGATKEDWKLQPRKKKGYHQSAWVGHRLPIAGEQASILTGTWRVAVNLDGITIGETSFRLEREPVALPEGTTEARTLYLELQYEQATEKLTALLEQSKETPARAEIAWWLALSQHALGRTEETRQTLTTLLQADRVFGVSPAQAKESGGEELAVLLETLRSSQYPELYKKTAPPPEAELSKSERAPILKKRRPLWKKLLYYVGIPVAVIGTGVYVGFRLEKERTDNPPLLDLRVDEARAESLPQYGSYCEGSLPMLLTVENGFPPYDLVIIAVPEGGARRALLSGQPLIEDLGTVVFKQQIMASMPLELPTLDVEGNPPGAAQVQLIAVVRDERTPLEFDKVVVGQAPPPDLLNALRFFDTLDRLVKQELFVVLVSDCAQNKVRRPW